MTKEKAGKVRKVLRLDPELLRRVQDDLSASTESEAVEMALDLVTFGTELSQGARRLRKLRLCRID